jgi:hypothetical protein
MGRALYIAKNAFNELKIGVSRIMHEEANMRDGIRNIRSSESEILQGTSETPIETRIKEPRPICGGQFGAGVSGCGDGIAIKYFSMV